MSDFLINIFKGILIGIANIIPGLSGSTLALILGVYEKIINILTKIDIKVVKIMTQLDFKSLNKHLSLNFLLPIIIGIVISSISLAHLLKYLFSHYETYTWSYFFGVILASILYISQYVNKWKKIEFIFFFFGVIISLMLFLINPSVEENGNLFFVFLCGVIGVAGMLIPGLSGSYLLLLLGNYKLLISDTLHYLTQPKYYSNDEIYIYLKLFITFLIGHIAGILIFSRIIKWLLSKYKNITFAILTGFITGSLLWIWPWKKTNIIHESSTNLLNQLSYPNFESRTDFYAIIIIILGTITIMTLEKVAKKR